MLNTTDALNNNSLPVNNGTLLNSGTLNNNGSFTNYGAVSIASAGQFTTSTDYRQMAGSTLVNGTLTATGGAIVAIHGGALGGTGTINGGVLMSGTIMPGGTLVPGDAPGTLTIFGNYEQTAGGILDELLGPSSQSLLNVNRNVMLDHEVWRDLFLPELERGFAGDSRGRAVLTEAMESSGQTFCIRRV